MKVLIAFPPLLKTKGVPQLTQNRQFQWFSHPTLIYPMIPASAATLLKLDKFDVNFLDGIAQRWSYERFIRYVEKQQPDLMAIETKTPVIKQHWRIIRHVKEVSPSTKVVLMGDHVTALPRESLEKSPVDFVITGGDFDVTLLQLAKYLRDGSPMPKGLWYREGDHVKNTGPFELIHNLDALPFVDRVLTKFWLYYENWYKRKPFAYMMAGRDCWWRKDGGCTFCAWTVLFPKFRVRSPERHLDEVGYLIEKYKVREIFDDTGTFPVGKWLEKFCKGMIERGYNDEVLFSCNFRYDQINERICKLMKKAGFRLLKVGLESASQRTLNMINKGITVKQIIDGSKIAKKCGLEIHLTIMVGFPWETRRDALKTLSLAKELMERGLADVLQATVIIPYPGTRLYYQALKFNWFRIDPEDYDRYDMTEPVLKSGDLTPQEIMKICDGIYKIYISPKYILRRFLKSLFSIDDLILNIRGAKAAIAHILDFAVQR